MPRRDPHRQQDPRPVPPLAPDPSECCGEGCAHCVLDQYDAADERYQADLAAWRVRQAAEDEGK